MRKTNKQSTMVLIDEKQYRGSSGFLDITGCRRVELEIDSTGTKIWVHANGQTVLRICQIEEPIELRDGRLKFRSRATKIRTRSAILLLTMFSFCSSLLTYPA